MSIYTFAVKNARVFVSGSNYDWADSVTKVWPDTRVGFELQTFFESEKSVENIGLCRWKDMAFMYDLS